ncbi:MAG: hypothetical protein RBT05_10450 [Bacteroidales bacterium]|jgi:hypothetical protein|nr:hypothetical protein [Bacteroidales bacterium]
MSNEQFYEFALWEAGLTSTDKKLWLEGYFDLYKTTLIWPPGFPPTRMCNMPEGTIREKFHSTYKRILSEFDYEFDNARRTLEFI